MRRYGCWVLAAVLAILSLSGCVRIRPEATDAERATPAVRPPPAKEEPAEGSAEGYPDEPRPARSAQREGEPPPVTWGALPVPVYPGARLDRRSDHVTPGEKPTAYRNFHYSTRASSGRVLAFYQKRLGTDIQVKKLGRQITVFKDLEKGNVVISIFPSAGRTKIDIQESQKL